MADRNNLPVKKTTDTYSAISEYWPHRELNMSGAVLSETMTISDRAVKSMMLGSFFRTLLPISGCWMHKDGKSLQIGFSSLSCTSELISSAKL